MGEWSNLVSVLLGITVVNAVMTAIILWVSHRDSKRFLARMEADAAATSARMQAETQATMESLQAIRERLEEQRRHP